MIFHSIRWRLQAWHGLILVVVLAGFGFTAYHVARDNQLRRIDQDLDQRLMALFRPQPPDRPPDRPPDWQRGGPGKRGGFPPNEPRNERAFGSPDFLRHIREAVQQGGALDPSQTNIYYYVMWQQDGSKYGDDNGGARCFEPRDGDKGDIARTMMYFSVRYQLPIDGAQEANFRRWNTVDPVSPDESLRHDKTVELQHNRNPFVDYPGFADFVEDF